jgi:hypothetical protein
VVVAAELAEDGGRLVDCAGDEGGIFAMGCVEVTTVEYADYLFIFCWEGLEELDEALLVINLGAC